MDSVDEDLGPGRVGEVRSPPDVVHGAEGVGGGAERQQPRSGAEKAGSSARSSSPLVGSKGQLAHDETMLPGELRSTDPRWRGGRAR